MAKKVELTSTVLFCQTYSEGRTFDFTEKIFLFVLQKSGSLQVHVHEAKGLPGGDLPDPPDPYVKLYLLPERSKKSKRKSDAKKDTVTPVFEETFDYDVEVLKMNSELEVIKISFLPSKVKVYRHISVKLSKYNCNQLFIHAMIITMF